MEIEIVKPTPEQAEFQKLFQNNEERTIKCLLDEIKELYDKLEAWEKCADQMYYYALTYPIKIQYPQVRVERDKVVEEYNKLKLEAQSNE
jgi:hypothetical protein